MMSKSYNFGYTTVILIIFQLAVSANLDAQDQKLFKKLFRQAESSVIIEDYKQAIEIYDQLLALDSTNCNLHFLISYSHLNARNNLDEAVAHLQKAVLDINEEYNEGSYLERSAPPVALFILGKTYLRHYDFELALEAFNDYKNYLDKWAIDELEYVDRNIKSCELAKQMIQMPIPVEFISLDSVTKQKESLSHPVISGNDSIMIFCIEGRRETCIAMIEKIDSTTWTEPRIIATDFGMSGTYYPTSLSYNGDELYLAYQQGPQADLFVSYYNGQKWSLAIPVGPPVNSKYAETHACISSDNNILYFTSNRKGGFGGMDIYKAVRNELGGWGEPENLGPEVNSYYNEDTPFITYNDSALYFSSEGHETMGGYDVFSSSLDDNGQFPIISNVGYPISTPGDDLFFNPGWSENKSYIVRPDDTNPSLLNIYAVVEKIIPEIHDDEVIVEQVNVDSLDQEKEILTEVIDNNTEEVKVDLNKFDEKNPGLHPGYIIQVMALLKPVKLDYFTSIKNVKMYAGSDGFYRYTYGHYATINDALKDIDNIKSKGFKTAFIRSLRYYENMRVVEK